MPVLAPNVTLCYCYLMLYGTGPDGERLRVTPAEYTVNVWRDVWRPRLTNVRTVYGDARAGADGIYNAAGINLFGPRRHATVDSDRNFELT